MRYFSLFLLLLSVITVSAQEENADLLDAYYAAYLPEKVFVHTDKSVYAGGETIHAAVYLVNGLTHQPDSLSKTIYLELYSPGGERVLRQLLYAADGHTAGALTLPATVVPGIYQLTAYTNYQRNSPLETLYRKSLRLVGGLKESGGVVEAPDAVSTSPLAGSTPTELRFFPESGDCVVGIPCKVAIVAEDGAGAPLTFAGTLNDGTGKQLAEVTTRATGIGTFIYTPRTGEYTVADARTGRVYRLPPPRSEGTTIAVEVAPDTVKITLRSNDAVNGLRGQTFLLHLRGAGLFEKLFTTADRQFTARFPTAILPPGVLVGTLLDPSGNATAERLFFAPPQETNITVAADREKYGLRAPVALALGAPLARLPDSLNAARLSASVLPVTSADGPPADDIRTWFLLNSDVDHPVQQAPELLFSGPATERTDRVDEFLLTRAWRRFRWAALPDLANFRPDYQLERGLYVRGRMTSLDNEDKARPGKIFLTRLTNAFADQAMTDEEGYFTMGPYITFDTFPVILQGRFKAGKKNRLNPEISLEDNAATKIAVLPPEGPELPPAVALSPSSGSIAGYQEASRKVLTVARTYDSLIIDLQTVDITAARIDKVEAERKKRTSGFYRTPLRRIDIAEDAYARNDVDIINTIQRIPGVQLRGSGSGQFFQIRNSANLIAPDKAAIFLNGTPVSNLDFIRNLQVPQVEFIDVLSGQQAVTLGEIAVGGAIMIYLKEGARGPNSRKGVLETTLQGYTTVREFATFDATLPDNRNRPDLRTTLHWAPLLRTDARGKTTVRFKTSDQTGEFLVFVQGLRRDGTPLYGEGRIVVE